MNNTHINRQTCSEEYRRKSSQRKLEQQWPQTGYKLFQPQPQLYCSECGKPMSDIRIRRKRQTCSQECRRKLSQHKLKQRWQLRRDTKFEIITANDSIMT